MGRIVIGGGRMAVMMIDWRQDVPGRQKREYSGYTGTYTYDGKQLVTTTVDAAPDPSRIGTKQPRGVRFRERADDPDPAPADGGRRDRTPGNRLGEGFGPLTGTILLVQSPNQTIGIVCPHVHDDIAGTGRFFGDRCLPIPQRYWAMLTLMTGLALACLDSATSMSPAGRHSEAPNRLHRGVSSKEPTRAGASRTAADPEDPPCSSLAPCSPPPSRHASRRLRVVSPLDHATPHQKENPRSIARSPRLALGSFAPLFSP